MELSTSFVSLDDLFQVWELQEWELRVCILFSLFLQIFLMVTGTFRRLASHQWIVILLWLAYLLADVLAVFGLGLIVSTQSLFYKYCVQDEARGCFNEHLHIYWAPFLLLHLGGPDIITAFAPEDNELWPRHLFYLGSQCIAVAYAFYQSLETNNQLRVPTIIMLLCGIIKCMERTYALYHGSAKSFRNSMLFKPDHNLKNVDIPQMKTERDPTLNHLQVLQYAFVYFTAFKGLVVDLKVSVYERNRSRHFFLATSYTQAFRLVEVELNYLYDVLFTKVSVLHNKLGYIFRTLSFIAVVVSFVLFRFVMHKHYYLLLDRKITYILLIGAIVLDVISFFMLLFCDWTIVKLWPLYSDANLDYKSWKNMFAHWILRVNNVRSLFLDCLLCVVGDRDPRTLNFYDSRWAHSLSTFSLISYCLHRLPKGRGNCYNYFSLLSYLHRICYVKPKPLTKHICELIFEELKLKSEKARTLALAKEICSSKGDWILNYEKQCSFLRFVNNYNYDDILVIWNIATELCYHDNQDDQSSSSILKQRDTAKQLSDYMLYLMVMQADMMSAVSSIGEKKFKDTCNEVTKLFDTQLPQLKKRKFNFFCRESQVEEENMHKKACDIIFSVKREIMLDTPQIDENVLFTASELAKELKVLPPEKRWLTISKFWVELLSYAASHIRSSAHAEQLSKGGELITVVWLLMAHLGLGDHFELNPRTNGDSEI